MIDKKAKDTFKEIKDLEEILKEDLDSWDPRSLPGKRTQHAQARSRIAELRKEYAKFVGQSCAAIFVSGDADNVETFTKLAEEKGGTITLDGRGVYAELANNVFERLRRNQIDYDHVANLNDHLQLIAAQAGYVGPLNVRFTKLLDRPFLTKTSLIDAIRPLVKEGTGDMFQWGYIAKQIEDRAFASGTANSPVPCVITHTGEDDKETLTTFVFGNRFVDVAVEGEVVPYTVTKAFNELKKKLKSITNTTEESTTTEE